MAAEETRFGLGTETLDNITFGDIQVEEVRFGADGLLVWKNNITPEFSNVLFNSNSLDEGDDLSILRRTSHNVSFSLTDEDMHYPVALRLLDGETVVDTDSYSSTDTIKTMSIPSTHYDAATDVGTVDKNWTIEATDTEDGVTLYEFGVTELDFTAPSISGTNSAVGSAQQHVFSYTISPSASGTGLSTTPSGAVTVQAACGGSGSQTVTATTTGGGLSRSASRTFTYSRTASSQGSKTCGAYGDCTANAATNCGFTATTCTASGTQTRSCTTPTIRLCDNANLGNVPSTESISCSDSNPNQSYVAPVSVSCSDGVANVSNATCSVTLGSNGSDITVSSYVWTIGGGTIASGQGTSSISISSSAAASGTGSVTVTFSDGSSTTTRTDSDTYSIPANNFACANAGYSVADGTTGDTVSASVSAGTLVSNSPSTYSTGTATYTGTITAPASFTNGGSNITCTDTAVGAIANPSIASCSYTASSNPIIVNTSQKTFGLSGTNVRVTLSKAEAVLSTVSATFNVNCTGQGGGVSVLTAPSSLTNTFTFFNTSTLTYSTANSNNGTYNASNNTNVNVNSNIRCTGSVTFTGTAGISGGSCTVSGLVWDE